MAARLMLHPPEGFCIVLRNNCLDLADLQEPAASPAGGGTPEQGPAAAGAPAGEPPQGAGKKRRKLPGIIVIGHGTYLKREDPAAEFTSIDHLLDEAKVQIQQQDAGGMTLLARIPHAEPLSPEQLKASLSTLPDDLNIIVQLEIPAAKEPSGSG
jgi:hypothetical protein